MSAPLDKVQTDETLTNSDWSGCYKDYNGLCLAYIGDAIYEIYVRKHALAMGLTKVNDLHRMVTGYTSALEIGRAHV